MSIKIFDKDTKEYPLYILIVDQNKMNCYLNSVFYHFKKNTLIENNIYLMLDDYEKDNVYFFNNEKRYKTIHKKFQEGNKIIYIPLQEYSRYYINNKIKICGFICEALGIREMVYSYNKFTHNVLNFGIQGGVSSTTINAKINIEDQESLENKDSKSYCISECDNLFLSLDEFKNKLEEIHGGFFDKNILETDLELNQLLHSRMVGNMSNYNLTYETKFLEAKEVELIAGLNINAGINVKLISEQKLSVKVNMIFYKLDELINNANMKLNEKCLRLIVQKKDIELLSDFIEKYIEEYKSDNEIKTKNTKDDFFSIYYYMKIIDPILLKDYIKEVKCMNDLNQNGNFFTNLRGTLYSALITLDDEGLKKIQKIYTMILRKNRYIEIENNITCYNIRCVDRECSCSNFSKPLKSIFCYFIRVYNNENSNDILTYGYTNNPDLAKTLHYIAINLKHMTNYKMMANFITKQINKFKVENNLFNEYYKNKSMMLSNFIKSPKKDNKKINNDKFSNSIISEVSYNEFNKITKKIPQLTNNTQIQKKLPSFRYMSSS
jgi:hypothetical protein